MLIAVIFEVMPANGRKEDYLNIAADLRPLLDEIEGFVSIERFQSLVDPGKILSLSFWRDEEAVAEWRKRVEHKDAQIQGRTGIFANYRLRVTSVIRDYGMNEREQAPQTPPELG